MNTMQHTIQRNWNALERENKNLNGSGVDIKETKMSNPSCMRIFSIESEMLNKKEYTMAAENTGNCSNTSMENQNLNFDVTDGKQSKINGLSCVRIGNRTHRT